MNIGMSVMSERWLAQEKKKRPHGTNNFPFDRRAMVGKSVRRIDDDDVVG